MSVQFSTTVRNARLDAIETAIGASPVLKLFQGTKPAACSDADAGTVLATVNLPSDWMAAASGGSKALSGTWQDTSADASGLAQYFRLYASGGSVCHEQGYVGQNWAASTAYILNQHVVNDSGKVFRCTTAGTSASSGGPTGTGSGITDGTAVWTYVGLVGMTLDNTNIAGGQAFTVATHTLTEGNA